MFNNRFFNNSGFSLYEVFMMIGVSAMLVYLIPSMYLASRSKSAAADHSAEIETVTNHIMVILSDQPSCNATLTGLNPTTALTLPIGGGVPVANIFKSIYNPGSGTNTNHVAYSVGPDNQYSDLITPVQSTSLDSVFLGNYLSYENDRGLATLQMNFRKVVGAKVDEPAQRNMDVKVQIDPLTNLITNCHFVSDSAPEVMCEAMGGTLGLNGDCETMDIERGVTATGLITADNISTEGNANFNELNVEGSIFTANIDVPNLDTNGGTLTSPGGIVSVDPISLKAPHTADTSVCTTGGAGGACRDFTLKDCLATNFPRAVAANGDLTCATVASYINGGWSGWYNVSGCMGACGGGGSLIQGRSCNNPTTKYGGVVCQGSSTRVVGCTTPPCPPPPPAPAPGPGPSPAPSGDCRDDCSCSPGGSYDRCIGSGSLGVYRIGTCGTEEFIRSEGCSGCNGSNSPNPDPGCGPDG